MVQSQFRLTILGCQLTADADTNPHKDPPWADQADDEVKKMVGLILPA